MLEVTEVRREWSLSELMTNLSAPRITIGMLDQHHVAGFGVASSIGLVKERLALTRSLLESRLAVNHAVELTYEEPVPRFELDVFVARGESLARAYAETRSFL